MKPDPRALFPGSPPELAARIGAGRAAIATGILAAPVASARFLGTDTATARRVRGVLPAVTVPVAAATAGAGLAIALRLRRN